MRRLDTGMIERQEEGGLNGITTIAARAESASPEPGYRFTAKSKWRGPAGALRYRCPARSRFHRIITANDLANSIRISRSAYLSRGGDRRQKEDISARLN